MKQQEDKNKVLSYEEIENWEIDDWDTGQSEMTGEQGSEEEIEFFDVDAEPSDGEETEYYEESEEYEGAAGGYEELGEYAEEDAEYYEESDDYDEEVEFDEYEGSEEYEESDEYEGSEEYEESDEYEGSGEYEGSEEYEESGEYETDEYGESDEYAKEKGIGYGDVDGLEEIDESAPVVPLTGRRKKGAWAAFAQMGIMDKAMLLTGVAVLILAVVTGCVYVGAKTKDRQKNKFVSVGAQLEGIDVIGDRGLIALADATAAKLAAAEIVDQESEAPEEPKKEYEETDYTQNITVELKMISVQKDLKIKFVNASTGKLISNVPFSVTMTTPDNKTEIWSDDDMDGIIYKKGITPGSYKVQVDELPGSRYGEYALPREAQKAEVKKDIAYKKIDVSDEVKTEAQVNVATEEQKKQELAVESTLTDTVQWVESTAVPSTYIEVAKSSITDPKTVAKSGEFMRMAGEVTLDKTSATTQVGGTPLKITATHTLDSSAVVSWSSSAPEIASVENGVVTPKAQGQAVITCTVTTTSNTSGGDGKNTYSATCTVTVTAAMAAGAVTVNPASVAVVVKGSASAQIGVSGFAEGKALSYTAVSANSGVATASVDANGKVTVTGVAAGTTTVTVTANYQETPLATAPSAVINVAVAKEYTVKPEKTAVTVYLTEPAELIATVAGAAENAPVTAKSSDTSIATVTVNGNRLTITGVKEGTANITVEYAVDDSYASAICAVTVKKHPKDDKETKLKDNSGNQLYVQENEEYREAVYADYYVENIKFFKKGDMKYTGWNTIDGKVYFFDAAGIAVKGEQVIQGAKYNFASDGSLVTGSGTLGIDVSKHNGTIDWNAVKNSGVSYVIIRCGYRGYTQGALIIDSKFQQNIKGATAAGLKVGIYFFSQAVDEVEAVQEASFVLDAVKGYTVSYPVFLDVEYSGASGNRGRADGLDQATRTAVCKAFCATIQSGGYTAGVYANKSWLETKIDPGQLGAYKIWLAQYAAEPTYAGRYDLWQYKATGKVSGISGNVDMDLSYLGY